MNELNIDYKAELAKYRDTKSRYVVGFGEHFLDHCIPILGSIPFTKNKKNLYCPVETVNAIKNGPDFIDTPNGKIHKNSLGFLLMYLYEVPRSKFVKGMSKSKHNARLATFTPLPMYAAKLHRGIPYDSWDADKEWMKFFLGSGLESIRKLKGKYLELDIPTVTKHRKLALEIGMDDYAKPDSYDCRIDYITVTGEDGNPDQKFTIGKTAVRMLLQLWIAHTSLRDKETMILDPFSWSSVPKPLDIAVEEVTDYTLEDVFGKIESAAEMANDVPWT